MADSLRNQVLLVASDIETHALGISRGSAHFDDPESSRVSAWSENLLLYVDSLRNLANDNDDASVSGMLERAKHSGHDVLRVPGLVASLRRATEEQSIERMQSFAVALAQLPGDPTIGLPPPIKNVMATAQAAMSI